MSVWVCLELIHMNETGSQLRGRSWRMTAVMALHSADIVCQYWCTATVGCLLCAVRTSVADGVQRLSAEDSGSTSLSTGPKFGKCVIAFWHGSWASPDWPSCRWRRIYSIGGMIWRGKMGALGGEHYTAWVVGKWMGMEHWWVDLTGENGSTGRKTCPVPLCAARISDSKCCIGK